MKAYKQIHHLVISLLIGLGTLLPSGLWARNSALVRSHLPYGAPDFSQLKIDDLLPAVEQGILEYEANIERIREIDPDQATFENVVCAMYDADSTLSRVTPLLRYLRSNFASDQIVKLSVETAPILSKLDDRISFDNKIFALINTLHSKRFDMGWDSLKIRTIEQRYRSYVRSGALCTPQQQARLAQINSELAVKRLQHGDNIVRETEGYLYLVNDSTQLKGLSSSTRAKLAARAAEIGKPGKWAIGLTNGDNSLVLSGASNRDLRKTIFEAQNNRCAKGGENDNRQLSADILNLRRERAQILGYETYSDYVLETNMAKNPANVYDLIVPLAKAAIKKGNQEMEELKRFVARQEGADFEIEPWDIAYYSNKLSKKGNLKRGNPREYLLFENVCKGVFNMSHSLYGLTFTQRKDIPVFHPDVRVFEVHDSNGKGYGLLYLDCFTRKGKRGGAWCSRLRSYSISDGVEKMPLVTISCNFNAAAKGAPQLLSTSEVKTLFHEFGHALAGFLSRGPYPAVTGNYPRDMVELPSQIHEHWAWEPQMLQEYARHYKTGKQMPKKLIDQLSKPNEFQIGLSRTNYYASTLLDIDWHMRTDKITAEDVVPFEQRFLERYGFPAHTIFRYRTTFFNHMFASSYPSQYYVYTWASVLDTDAFEAFIQAGDIFDPQVAERFRRYILTEMGYDEPMTQYLKFRGSLPKPEALMKRYGFDK